MSDDMAAVQTQGWYDLNLDTQNQRNVPPTQKRPMRRLSLAGEPRCGVYTRAVTHTWDFAAHVALSASYCTCIQRPATCLVLEAPTPQSHALHRIHPAPKTFPPPCPKNMFRPRLGPIVIVCVLGCARR